MTRNLKAVGLALVAVLAMTAVAASAAQAGQFTWENGTTLATAKQEAEGGSQLFKITGGLLTVTCDEVKGHAAISGSGPAASITTTEITYNDSELGGDKCTGPLGTQPVIEMNGCQYRFNAGSTTGSGVTQGTVDIINCTNADKSITINGGALCTVHVPEQTGVGPVTYRTINPGSKKEVTIEPNVVNIAYHHTGLCGNATNNNGTYTGNVIVKGQNAASEQTDVTVE